MPTSPVNPISWLSGLNLLKALTELIDSIVSKSGEKEELRKRMMEIVAEYEQGVQTDLTKRLESDNASSSWLTRNVRPLVLLYLTLLITLLAIFKIGIEEAYMTKIIDAWWMGLLFYYGSRGIEKIVAVIKNPKTTKTE